MFTYVMWNYMKMTKIYRFLTKIFLNGLFKYYKCEIMNEKLYKMIETVLMPKKNEKHPFQTSIFQIFKYKKKINLKEMSLNS